MGISVLISYSTKDSEVFQIPLVAEKLQDKLEIDNVFYWERDLNDDIFEYMNTNLKTCSVLLLFCSENSDVSEAVKLEWMAALKLKKAIIPIFFDEKDIPPLLTTKLGIKFETDNINDFVRCPNIFVDDDADPSWYDDIHVETIQEGIMNASVGDIIYVYNGLYYENIVINKTVYLFAESQENTIIDGFQNNNVITIVEGYCVRIDGFTIRNSDEYGYGIYHSTIPYKEYVEHLTVLNNNIENLSCEDPLQCLAWLPPVIL